jgi:hypothetical protein
MVNLVISAITTTKFFYKTFVKLCNPIEHLNLLWFLRWWHVTIACILFGYGSFPFLETIKPNLIPKNTINAHLFRFRLMPPSLHFWKHNMSFYIWFSMSLYTVNSSINIFIKLSKYSLNALVTTLCYVGGPFLVQMASPSI